MHNIRRVAVLGAGTMGARIAAHFANAGVSVLLLDLTTERAAAGLAAAAASNPGAFYLPAYAARVEAGSFDADLPRLTACDWVIEAVSERLEIKRDLWSRVAAARRPGSIASTNTSGIPLSRISESFDADLARHFCGTHFFNPPRLLPLCELIPGPSTDPAVLADVAAFLDRRLGKGVVAAKDTPNFIGNRIGVVWGAAVYHYTLLEGLTVSEVDALTGPVIGLPRSASYRLVDVIGLDVWTHVAETLLSLSPAEPWPERLAPPAFVTAMLERGWLGDKAGQGFYRRVGKEKTIEALDLATLEYAAPARPSLPAWPAALAERLPQIVRGEDRYSRFLWQVLRDALWYAAWCIPAAADRIVEIDRAMRWGYGHTYGPFELWDLLGFEPTARRMAADGLALPEPVERMLSRGARGFYRPADENRAPRNDYFDLTRGYYQRLEPRPGVISLAERRRSGSLIERGESASLIDLGDGCLCLELHALNDDALALLDRALATAARDHRALVIGNQGELFSLGADLAPVLAWAQAADWPALEAWLLTRQRAHQAIRTAAVPVVAAPHGRTLGTAAELVLHAPRAVAAAETYLGLNHPAAGLLPAAGGLTELAARELPAARIADLLFAPRPTASADEARALGLLDRSGTIVMNPDRLLGAAKAEALAMAEAYRPAAPRAAIALPGALEIPSRLTGFDREIAARLAAVLTGPEASDQTLLDREREAFLSLAGDPRAQARLEHLLRTGRPLRN